MSETENPAEALREAAVLMRSRAERAEPGRWKLWGMTVMADPKGTSDVDDCIEVAVAATPSWCERRPRTWNATHIASWHPAVALAVADWMDSEAESIDSHLARQADPERRFANVWTIAAEDRHEHALTVARAYMGRP